MALATSDAAGRPSVCASGATHSRRELVGVAQRDREPLLRGKVASTPSRRELVGVAQRDREPLLRVKVTSTHVGDGARHDRSHLLAIEAADAQSLARLDLTRRAREVVATLVAEAQLAVHALDDESPVVQREVVRLALCRLRGYAA
jgi:hypothetical protein